MKLLTNELEHAEEEDYRMALATARFEKEYNQVHARTTQLLDAERGRVQCMEQLLLRFENENLQLQVGQTGLELVQVKEAESITRLQLQDALRELDRLQNVAQASSRELDNLRQELTTMNAVASDTQKLQAERVRLAKEVSSVQSEVEKLRSRNNSANELVTEKQAISRQLNAVEVQLENEQRAHQRAIAKQFQQAEEVAALSLKLEETRQELQLARRHGQQDTHPNGGPLRTHRSPVSSKGRGTGRGLPISRDRHQEETPTQQQDGWTGTTTKVPVERPDEAHPKKLASRLHSELTIATPGAVRAQNQQKRSSTLPGEKSSFSITPFLNRTTGLEEPGTSSDDELNESYIAGKEKLVNDMDAPSDYAKPPVAKQASKPTKQVPTKAALEGDLKRKQKQNILDSLGGAGGYQDSLTRSNTQKQPLAKKRKLGMQRERSLFGDDEDDNGLGESKKQGRKIVGTGQTNLAGGRAFTGPVGFSPLKRDKKRF